MHKFYQLKTSIILPAPREIVFDFFSRAENLEKITPPWLNFRFVSPPPQEITAGTHIQYALRLHRLPFRWRTEISMWEPPLRFVDRQLNGPYREWIHEHRFEVITEKRTQMTDIVHYRLPLGILGKLVHELFVRRDVEEIFRYRRRAILHLFNARENAGGETLKIDLKKSPTDVLTGKFS